MTNDRKIKLMEKVMGTPVLLLTRYSRPGFDARYAQVDDTRLKATRICDAASDDDAIEGLLNSLMKAYPADFEAAMREQIEEDDAAIAASLAEISRRAAGFRELANAIDGIHPVAAE